MSAVAATRDTPLPDRSTATRFSGLVRAEVAKLTSTRAAGWLVLAAAALSALAVSGVVNAGVARSALATETGVRTVLGHGGLAAILLVLAGLQRPRWGSVAGTVAQVPVLACGFVVPMMFAVGGLFAVLWVLFLRLGVRIDSERAVFDAAHPDAVEPARPRRRY